MAVLIARVLAVMSFLSLDNCAGEEFVVETKHTRRPDVLRLPDNPTVNVTEGSNITLTCTCNDCDGIKWFKNYIKHVVTLYSNHSNCQVTYEPIVDTLSRNRTHNCRNNFNNVEYSITFHGITPNFGERWICRNQNHKIFSDFIIFAVEQAESVTPTYTVSTPGAPRYSHSSTTTTEHTVMGGTSTAADNENSSLGGNSLTITVIGAAAGGVFVLICVITLIAVVVKKKSNTGRHGGTSDREKITVEEYAQIGAVGHRNSLDEVNPIYEGCDSDKEIIKPMAGEGGDVYSVVQKPKKVETTDEQRTEDAAGDVYSVVQKPKKSQPTSTDSTTHGNEVTDIYSVVQKPSSR